MRLAYLCSPNVMPGSPECEVPVDVHDLTVAVLRDAARRRDGSIDEVLWDDPDADWAAYDAVLVGSSWDYTERREVFLEALARVEAQSRLFNSLEYVRWNSHKKYLAELAGRGVRTIETVWLDEPTEAAISGAFDILGTREMVVKRQVGAGGGGQVRLRLGNPIPPFEHPMMAQPFIPAVAREGEFSFLYVDGQLSHTVLKEPKAGDYRVQMMYGGESQLIQPSEKDLAAAEAVMKVMEVPPLYARVDMVRGADGHLLLMELEAVEPYLFVEEDPGIADRLVDAVINRLWR